MKFILPSIILLFTLTACNTSGSNFNDRFVSRYNDNSIKRELSVIDSALERNKAVCKRIYSDSDVEFKNCFEGKKKEIGKVVDEWREEQKLLKEETGKVLSNVLSLGLQLGKVLLGWPI